MKECSDCICLKCDNSKCMTSRCEFKACGGLWLDENCEKGCYTKKCSSYIANSRKIKA